MLLVQDAHDEVKQKRTTSSKSTKTREILERVKARRMQGNDYSVQSEFRTSCLLFDILMKMKCIALNECNTNSCIVHDFTVTSEIQESGS